MAPTSQWSSWSNIQSLVLIVIALVVGSLAKSQTVDQLQLSNGLVSPDGIERQAILVNGELFRKPIVGTKGDEFVIEVDNQLTIPELRKSTSIHWHGLTQRGSAWADGASFITQCPIAPGNLFTYRFSVLDQAGTFWYHSHLSAQYCDGLRGAIVVHDPQDPQLNLYDVDDENTIITLADWYHSPASKLSGVVKPDSTLINGLGRTAATTDAPLAIISVQQGIRYRMRLIAMSCDPNWNFSIEGHELQVIEADAVNVEPITVKSLQIFAAQRYSFVLHANQPIDNYWVRANPNTGNPGFLGGINSAILRYAGAPEEEPRGLGSQLPTPELRETDLHPIESPRVPGRPEIDGADVNLIFNIGFNSGEFSINGHSFKPPTTPTLLQILSGTHQASDLLPQGSYYALPRNKVVQVSFPILNSNHSGGAVGAPHPFHLHGHTFSVVRSAGSLAYNFDNPVRRDVVSIGGAGDNVTIRFTTDNAGPWFLHCHIEWHFRSGLAVVLAEDVPGIIDGPEPPQEWQDLCTIYNDLDPKDQ